MFRKEFSGEKNLLEQNEFKINHHAKSKQLFTVKPVLSDHSKIDRTKFSMTDGSLMKVEILLTCIKLSLVLKTNFRSF